MRAFRNTPVWFIALFLVSETLLLFSVVSIVYDRYQRLEQIDAELEGVVAIDQVFREIELLGAYRGSCAAALVLGERDDQIENTCQNQVVKITNLEFLKSEPLFNPERHTRLPHQRLEADRFFFELTELIGKRIQYINQIYIQASLSLDNEERVFVLASPYAETLPYIAEYADQIRGSTALLFAEFIDVADLDRATTRLLDEVKGLQASLAVSTDLDLETSKSARLFEGRIARLMDSYLEEIVLIKAYLDQIKNDDFIDPTIRSRVTSELYQTGTDIIAEVKGSAEEIKIALTKTLNDSSNRIWTNLTLIGSSVLILQILLLVVLYLLSRAFNQAQASRIDAEKNASQLSATLEAQERMFAIIGHEIRSPAASLVLLLDELEHKTDPSTLAQARSTASHLIEVIDDMRISRQGYIPEFAKEQRGFSVTETLKNVVAANQVRAIEQGLKLHLQTDDIQSEHLGAPKSVWQIASNLVRNAILHSQGSNVWVQLSAQDRADSATAFQMTVRDDGYGIPNHQIERLYQAFERGDSKSEGRGLGLNICKILAEQLPEGSIRYRNADQGGAEFEVRFVLDRLSKSAQPDLAYPQLQGLNILLVEDTPTLRLLTQRLLEKVGAQVDTAEEGGAGLKKLAEHHYDLILTDIMMPEVDGYEFVREAIARGTRTPIIGVTAATVGRESETLIECGARAVLFKPIKLDKLAALVDQFVHNDADISPPRHP